MEGVVKVKELIEKLKQFDGELEVICYGSFTGIIEDAIGNEEKTEVQLIELPF